MKKTLYGKAQLIPHPELDSCWFAIKKTDKKGDPKRLTRSAFVA